MKKLLVILALLSVTASQVFGAELKSANLKKLVCEQAAKYPHMFNIGECMKSKMLIEDVEKITFKKKEYVVAMDIKAEVSDSDVMVTMSRGVKFVGSTPKLGEWSAKLTKVILGDRQILLNSATHSKNVKEITSKREIAKLPKTVKGYKSEAYVPGEVRETDVELTIYKVYRGRKLIGYISHVWFANERADIKGYSEQSFDLKGKAVGEESIETMGYHE